MCLFSGSVLAVFNYQNGKFRLILDEAASSGSTSGNSVANMVSSSWLAN